MGWRRRWAAKRRARALARNLDIAEDAALEIGLVLERCRQALGGRDDGRALQARETALNLVASLNRRRALGYDFGVEILKARLTVRALQGETVELVAADRDLFWRLDERDQIRLENLDAEIAELVARVHALDPGGPYDPQELMHAAGWTADSSTDRPR